MFNEHYQISFLSYLIAPLNYFSSIYDVKMARYAGIQYV
jgi:hypothetical protein